MAASAMDTLTNASRRASSMGRSFVWSPPGAKRILFSKKYEPASMTLIKQVGRQHRTTLKSAALFSFMFSLCHFRSREKMRYASQKCPRRESNPHLRFRKPPFYPLNYEDK